MIFFKIYSGPWLQAGGPSGLFTSSFSFSPQGDLVQLYFIISFWQTSKYKKWQIIFSKLIYKDILSPQYGQMEQIFLFRNVLKWYICSMGLVQMGFVQLGIVQMGVVHTMHCLIISREGLILTLVNPSLSTGKDFLFHSLKKDWWWENVRTPPKLGRYWEIHPLRPRASPSENL